MKAMVVGTAVGLALGFAVTAAASQGPPPGRPQPTPASGAVPTGPGSLSGVWSNGSYRSSERYSERERILLTDDGQWPPLLPDKRALLEARIKGSEQGKPYANTLSLCLPGGMPQMLFGAGYPTQIIENATQVIFLFEEQNHFRIIRLNAKHAEDPDPTYWGDSVGHWEGNTLVVDTIGLTERTSLDQIGMPHSEDLHLVERYSRTAANRMDIAVTIDDPKTFSRPWVAKGFWRLSPPGSMPGEYICENNRNQPNADGTQGLQTP